MTFESSPDFSAYTLQELLEAQAGINREKYPLRAKEIESLIAWRQARRLDVRGSYPERIRSLPLFDGAFDAYKLAAENASVLFATYPAGTEIAPHTHDTDNYGVITRGELLLTMNGNTTRHEAGSWYHVPAGAAHSARFMVDTEEIEFWFDSTIDG